MTNFEIITSSVYNLEKFIDMLQEDALEAKGCSRDITMPDRFDENSINCLMWSEWLEQVAEDDVVITTKGSIHA